ncbi:MAG: hypothetical protein NT118_03675, partial [Lentisphaerae bacterium]|nr:hypothetical protein [Lentisphaerota bacterium]
MNDIPELKHGSFGIFAARESGRHPDTGCAAEAWATNLNGPIADKFEQQLLGVCQRTGLAGYLWDSVSNLGWWQVDYSTGTMRPQFDRFMGIYSRLTKAGLYLMPEAIAPFSSNSCCGMHAGDNYAGDLNPFAYKTIIGFMNGEDSSPRDLQMIKGLESVDPMFRAIANKRGLRL